MGCVGRAIVVATLLFYVISAQAAAQENNDLVALNWQAVELHPAGKDEEAVPIAQRALALAERLHGPDHPDVGASLNNLAALYQSQARYVEAEPLYKRALSIREKAWGPDHPHVGNSLNNLRDSTSPKAAMPRPSRSTDARSQFTKSRSTASRCR